MASTRHNLHRQHLNDLVLLRKTEEYPSNPYSRHFTSTLYRFCLLLPARCCSTLYLLSRLLPILYFCNVERDSLCNNNCPNDIPSISHRSHNGHHHTACHHSNSGNSNPITHNLSHTSSVPYDHHKSLHSRCL